MEYVNQGDTYGAPFAHRARAVVFSGQSKPDWKRAIESLDAAFEMGNAAQARPDLAITHFRYAECLHKKGDLDAAREQLDQAKTLFRDMGMGWWTDQAEGLRGRIDSGQTFVWFAPYVDGPPSI